MQNQFATLSEIRKVFLNYFKTNHHEVVPSSSLVPENDPTLLFTNAGMVQFKEYFTGQKAAPFQCATTAQKCVRAGGKHNDLENVGYTARHHTFFEMLGNFSFGAYFKEEAIYHAWTVVTKELGLSSDQLCVTVFADDDQAFNIWKKITNFPDHKIIRIGTTDNFWSMGDTGPCGPCSEIFYDHGDQIAGGLPGSANEDGDRFIEIWNLVFMQYEQSKDGLRKNLPQPCIDTGMGLERVAAILQHKDNNFDIDLFRALIDDIRTKTECWHGFEQSCNVIADHIRSSSFLIADGVLPLNEGRGYVLRRIIRRAVRHVRLLGMSEPVLYSFVDKLIELMGEQYTELIQHQSLIKQVLLEEEKRFRETLDFGLKLVDESVHNLSGTVLPGDIAFKLYDTYGFPLDLTVDVLRSRKISVDLEGFDRAMQKQKDLSKKTDHLGIKVSFNNGVSADELEQRQVPATIKKCYESTHCNQCKILFVNSVDADRVDIILDQTPFFAESGGQVGDTGEISDDHELKLNVMNTRAILSEGKCWVLHECQILSGQPQMNQRVKATVDLKRRKTISAHHSATHILQAAMREILGMHITQKGSLVDEHKLRFDFTHVQELSDFQKTEIENRVNHVILSATPTETLICSKDTAVSQGALAFFNEKYGEEVRMVQIGKNDKSAYFSKELCGGTHVSNTGEIGAFKILTESGIAAGVRRIEAVCGNALLQWLDANTREKQNIIDKMKEENKQLQKKIMQLETENAINSAEVLTELWGEYQVTLYKINHVSAQQTRTIANDLTEQMQTGVLFVLNKTEDQLIVVVSVGKAYFNKIKAHEIVKGICQTFGGHGGGKANIAQCGNIPVQKLDEIIKYSKDLVKRIK